MSNEADVKERKIGFLGISNDKLDKSKMSRFLIIQRPELTHEDLLNTSQSICQSIFEKTKESVKVQEYLKNLSKSYITFINFWKTANEGERNMEFFGLRDFYNLIKTFADQIKSNENEVLSE